MSSSILSPSWRNWVSENTKRGVARRTLYDTLRKNGFGLAAIQREMGDSVPDPALLDAQGRDGSKRTTFYKELSECPLTRNDAPNLKRFSTRKAQVYVWDDFLSPDACQALIALTNASLVDSTVTTKDKTGFRTSKTCYLSRIQEPVVEDLEARICKALGVSNAWSEPNQAQKYAVGQEFKAHTDYFEPGSDEYKTYCTQMGQRTWTFMIYLNEGCRGGGTRFRKLEKTFYPKLGRAVIWNNLTPSGDPNPNTIHHGMKVQEGEKFVITKWFRDIGEGPLFC